MPRFFAEMLDNERAVIEGPDALHIAGPLRRKTGHELPVRVGEQGYSARIAAVKRNRIELELLEPEELVDRSSRCVHLGISMIAAKEMDQVMRFCSELGVATIQPLLAERSNLREASAKRLSRWQDICLEGVKQSQRRSIPQVAEMVELADFVKKCPWPQKLVATQGASATLNGMEYGEVGILIGPEGGFSPEEEALIEEAGFVPVCMGGTILRAVTAAVSAVAILGG